MVSPVGFHSDTQFRFDEHRQASRTSTGPVERGWVLAASSSRSPILRLFLPNPPSNIAVKLYHPPMSSITGSPAYPTAIRLVPPIRFVAMTRANLLESSHRAANRGVRSSQDHDGREAFVRQTPPPPCGGRVVASPPGGVRGMESPSCGMPQAESGRDGSSSSMKQEWARPRCCTAPHRGPRSRERSPSTSSRQLPLPSRHRFSRSGTPAPLCNRLRRNARTARAFDARRLQHVALRFTRNGQVMGQVAESQPRLPRVTEAQLFTLALSSPF
jgi:hypothetical protein